MLPSRRIVVILATSAAVVASSTVMGATSAVGAASPGVAAGSSAPQKVIVVLRDQLASTPASKTNMAPRRSPSDQLAGRRPGPSDRRPPRHTSSTSRWATRSRQRLQVAQAAALAADPAVASVDPGPRGRRHPASGRGTARAARPREPAAATPSADSTDAVCPSDPAQPLVEPEALQSIRALTSDGSPNAQQLADGHGVKVAFIADSLDPNNPDFIRPNGQHVFVDYQDFSGAGPSAPSDGREAFGDASSIAAQGTVVARPVAVRQPGPPAAARAATSGSSALPPGASLVGLVFGSNSSILQAIDYAVEHRPRRRHQRVVRAERLPGHQHAQRADAVQRRRGGRRASR